MDLMSQHRQITLNRGSPFQILFPVLGWHRVNPARARSLGFYRMKYELVKLDIPTMIHSEGKVAEAVMRLSSLPYGVRP